LLLVRFFSTPFLKTVSQRFLEWQVVIAAFALGLGGINLIRVHRTNIVQRRGAWKLSYVTLAFLIVPAVIGIALTPKHPAYVWLYDAFYAPLSATIASLLAFWICSACYRAFRVRNLQAFLLLGAAIMTMFGRVGISQVAWPFSIKVADWIVTIPNSAAMRALGMVIALGMVGAGLQVLFGLERRVLRGDE
jgi:hypothetical protein